MTPSSSATVGGRRFAADIDATEQMDEDDDAADTADDVSGALRPLSDFFSTVML